MAQAQPPSCGSVAVIGAGVSGLAAAYRLTKEGADVTIFEAGDHAGGAIQSFSKDGFLWESAANTMAENDPLIGQLIQDLNIEDQRVWPANANKRYIVKDGKPVQAPANPLSLLGSSLLSPGAKLRALVEPLFWKRKKRAPSNEGEGSTDEDESIGDFLERHIGREPVDYLLDPFLAGTSGSDPQSTAVKYAYPNLYEWEQNKGSLLIGAIAAQFSKKKQHKVTRGTSKVASANTIGEQSSSDNPVSPEPKKKKQHRGSFSFVGGMQTLPNALADHVGRHRLRTKTPVTHLDVTPAGTTQKRDWTVSFSTRPIGRKESRHFDAVLVTAPLEDFKNRVKVTKADQPFSLAFVPKITYQPMTSLIQGFRTEDVKQPLEGFGVLVPSKEGEFKTLGTLFNSYMFPNRAPPGFVTFTTFIGGSRHPELPGRPKEELQDIAARDLRTLLGVQGKPTFVQHIYWERAFPQYGKGYGQVLAAIGKLEEDLPGLYVAGNHRDGLAVGKALLSGYDAAGRILTNLKGLMSDVPAVKLVGGQDASKP